LERISNRCKHAWISLIDNQKTHFSNRTNRNHSSRENITQDDIQHTGSSLTYRAAPADDHGEGITPITTPTSSCCGLHAEELLEQTLQLREVKVIWNFHSFVFTIRHKNKGKI
jgi:hypothetical protein